MSATEITAVRCEAERGLVIHSLLNPPLRLQFVSEQEVEDWAAHLTEAVRTSRNCTGVFSRACWALSDSGDPYVHESQQQNSPDSSSVLPSYEMEMFSDAGNNSSLFIHDLPPGFHRDCSITISGAVPSSALRFSVNLQCGTKIRPEEIQAGVRRDVALHVNPRFDTLDGKSCELVRNTFVNNMWDVEEKSGTFDLLPGSRFTLSIQCQRQHYLVGRFFCSTLLIAIGF